MSSPTEAFVDCAARRRLRSVSTPCGFENDESSRAKCAPPLSLTCIFERNAATSATCPLEQIWRKVARWISGSDISSTGTRHRMRIRYALSAGISHSSPMSSSAANSPSRYSNSSSRGSPRSTRSICATGSGAPMRSTSPSARFARRSTVRRSGRSGCTFAARRSTSPGSKSWKMLCGTCRRCARPLTKRPVTS